MEKQLTEKEFIKTRLDDIVNVSKLFEGINEYAVIDKEFPNSLLLYRFRKEKNTGLFELEREGIPENIPNRVSILGANYISTISIITIYALLLANINIIKKISLEFLLPPILIYLYTIAKLAKYKLNETISIEKAEKINRTCLGILLPLVLLLIHTAIIKHTYYIIIIYLLLAILASFKYITNILRYSNNYRL